MKNWIWFVVLFSAPLYAAVDDSEAVKRAIRDYIESQHKVAPERMARALDEKLAKRTYWHSTEGREFILETDYSTMLRVAESYNRNGDKFTARPKAEIRIYDIDNRVASAKLTTDDWIDYFHLIKNDAGQWKIVNVAWQFLDERRHSGR